jgi:hypothetical protein
MLITGPTLIELWRRVHTIPRRVAARVFANNFPPPEIEEGAGNAG